MISGSLLPRHGASSGCGWRIGLQKGRGGEVAANILNKHCGQPTRGGGPALGLGVVLITPHRKNVSCYEMFTLKT